MTPVYRMLYIYTYKKIMTTSWIETCKVIANIFWLRLTIGHEGKFLEIVIDNILYAKSMCLL